MKILEPCDRNSEMKRLGKLWAGEFGDAYTERNPDAGYGRGAFWQELMSWSRPRRVLEVGCNIGANLRWIARIISPDEVFGLDINRKALLLLRQRVPGVNALMGIAHAVPFRDGCFDLVFTTGVLIHQPPEVLPLVMAEIVRCSQRYVLCGEYFAEQLTEMPYRGQRGALFKRDFGGLYQQLFPQLRLIKTGFLPRDQGGWDDVTYWIFEKPR